MVEIEIVYPQMTFEKKFLTVSKEEWEQIRDMTDRRKAEFITENLSDEEANWAGSEESLESAIEVGYAWVKERK